MANNSFLPTWLPVNDTFEGIPLQSIHPFRIFQAAAYAIIGSVTILASLATIAIIIQNLRLRKNQDFLDGEQQKISNVIMISMFVADIIFSIGYLFPRFVIPASYNNNVYCSLVSSIAPTIITIINLSLMAISIDTLDCIINPFHLRFRTNSKRIGLLISIGIWIIAVLVGITPFIVSFRPINQDYCIPMNIDEFEKEQAYFLSVIGISFLLPLIVMIYCYTRIFMRIRRSNFNDKIKRKTAKVLSVFVSIYFVMWLPFVICLILNAIYRPVQLAEKFPQFGMVVAISQLIAFSYPAINPILYGYYVPSVRRFMVFVGNKILSKLFYWRRN
ncbi:C-C chemokine receptor type 3 [Trichoplax sp. H2]|nr:C-C chemokine receptor type 3 [Trichoplax sp. H2]|eukprot:RDD45000.1 C-C chemokine receptor type 3 [Trichoplax sp. H2]